MATHSCVLAWRIPGTGEPSGLPSLGSHRVGQDRMHPQQSVDRGSSVTQLYLTLCNPMNRSTPGLPVHHQLPEFTQTHVHRVSDAIQPSHPL